MLPTRLKTVRDAAAALVEAIEATLEGPPAPAAPEPVRREDERPEPKPPVVSVSGGLRERLERAGLLDELEIEEADDDD